MNNYRYRLLNVFAINDQRLSGNPLCVFEDARGLDDTTMQALALQFNLSETTFIFPCEQATAQVRIFTPSYELPFAGHPTLGTAQVVRELCNAGDALTLQMHAGIIPVKAQGNSWTLQANPPMWREPEATVIELANMLGVTQTDICASPLWVNAGMELLAIPLKSIDAVMNCEPSVELLKRYARLPSGQFLVYVFALASNDEIAARFFFAKGNGVVEDPATGAACAALGGWFIATAAARPLHKQIRQGSAVGRASQLGLHVDSAAQIFVTGLVHELGRGAIEL